MLEIKNTETWGIQRAIKASGNAMSIGKIDTTEKSYLESEVNRARILGANPVGSAHDHYLLGCHVQFDIKYPQYWTIEAERYHNFEIITSQSKMHKLTYMLKDSGDLSQFFNQYVDKDIIDKVQGYIECYNNNINWQFQSPESSKYFWFMKALSNLPMGFEMWMTCDLTYLQLKTMYYQRCNHKLKEDWGVFCNWCHSLPYFDELTGIKEPNNKQKNL